MAFWRRKARKKSTPQGASLTPNIDTAVPRKLFPPEVKLQAIKALEAGLEFALLGRQEGERAVRGNDLPVFQPVEKPVSALRLGRQGDEFVVEVGPRAQDRAAGGARSHGDLVEGPVHGVEPGGTRRAVEPDGNDPRGRFEPSNAEDPGSSWSPRTRSRFRSPSRFRRPMMASYRDRTCRTRSFPRTDVAAPGPPSGRGRPERPGTARRGTWPRSPS